MGIHSTRKRRREGLIRIIYLRYIVSTPKHKIRSCRHDVHFSILSLTSRKPTTVKELYDNMGVSYPRIKANISFLTRSKLIEPVHTDGELIYSPPSKRRLKMDKKTGDVIPLRMCVMPIRIGDYPYVTTRLGNTFLEKMKELNNFEAAIVQFDLSTRNLPRIALQKNRFKGHRRRE